MEYNVNIIHTKNRNQFINIVKEYNLFYHNPKESAILIYQTKLTDMRLAKIDDIYVGCACSCPKFSCLVYVLPFYRGKGIGSRLVQNMNYSKVDDRPSLSRFWKKNEKS